ncbi:MAG: 4Fe-4S binding protein [Candidatus Hodarchaeales archaeon]
MVLLRFINILFTHSTTQNQILPFQPISVIVLFYWIIAFLFSIILIESKLMTRKVSYVLYFITIILVGIILGGVPNATMFIQETLATISSRNDLSYLLPALVVFSILLFSSLLVGRMFCGFLCPLGALQELISKIKFKSDPKAQRDVKHYVVISSSLAAKIRWIFFLILIFSAWILELSILQTIDPLLGFENIASILVLSFSIPFVLMIIVLFASFFVYRPWCRFFCPFGALSCTLAGLSKTKYQRTDACIECGDCEKICPTQEASAESKKGECYYCNRCIEVCPKDAIVFSLD